MIVVKLSSGLGNQLFMFALMKLLEQQNPEADIVFEVGFFSGDHSGRKSEIEILYPNYPRNEKLILLKGLSNKYLKGISKFILKNYSKIVTINDSNISADALILDSENDYFFDGYWQTDSFVSKLNDVANLFQPKERIPALLKEYKDEITNAVNACSIHIRRGDYFSELYIDRYGVCTEDYYSAAIEMLLIKTTLASQIFVFSDDLEWVAKNIKFPVGLKVSYIENHPVNSYWFIYLMSLCHNNIISNSTFSWWGAYLNRTKEKVVIAPDTWRFDSNENPVLNSWIKIKI